MQSCQHDQYTLIHVHILFVRIIEKTEPLEVEGEAVEGSVVYEEIGEVRETFNYTQNILYGKFSSGIPTELNTELASVLVTTCSKTFNTYYSSKFLPLPYHIPVL